MSGETEQNVSAWTIDSLRSHLEQIAADLDKRYEQRFQAQEKAIDAATATETKLLDERFAAQEKAVAIASAAQEKRFDAMNEFRAQLTDERTSYLPRTEYASAHSALIEKVDANTNRLVERIGAIELRINSIASTSSGAADQRNNARLNMGALIGLAGFVLSVMVVATTVILAVNK